MPSAGGIQESVSAISDSLEMGLIEQAERLYRSAVREWGHHTELLNMRRLIDSRLPSDKTPAVSSSKYCLLCSSSFNAFSPLPEDLVRNMIRYRYRYMARGEMTSFDEYLCPVCGASDRERLYAVWIKREATSRRVTGVEKIIHFAPEPALSKLLRSMNIFADYKTADISMPGVDYRDDITALPFEDESFDFFICSHVLEHVVDDHMALSELLRITRKGGRGILMVPISTGLERSIESTGKESAEERWRLFGQNDHVRLYAHDDFVSKVVETGFHLTELNVNSFGRKLFESLGLRETSILYVVEKW